MRVDIRFHGLQRSQTLHQHAKRRVFAQLSRFGDDVRSVTLRLADVNGPRGGHDKRCQISVLGPKFEKLHLVEVSDSAYVAVDGAISRMSVVIGKKIKRTHGQRTKRQRVVESLAS